MSGRRIIVHFGFPKTGTTTIQNVFHAQRESLLERERVLYPALNPNLTNALCTMFLDNPLNHISNKMAGLSLVEAQSLGEDYRAQLEAEVNAASWDTLLLSAEGLSNLGAANLGRLREWLGQWADEVELFACVRDPLAYTASVIQQIMKGGPTLAELYDELPLPNYQGKLSNAIRAFGRENVRIYAFEDAIRSQGGVVAEFARQARLSEERALDLAARAERDNESLSGFGVAVLDALNTIRPMFVDGQRNPERSGRELMYLTRLRGGRFQLPADMSAKVLSLTRDDVAWLNEAFGTALYLDADSPVGSDDHAVELEMAASVAAVIGDLVNAPNRPRH